MIIRNFELAERDSRIRVSADVVWERGDRPSQRIFAEVDAAHAGIAHVDANGFLVAALVPAWNAGEDRIRVEGQVCPVLLEGLASVTALLRGWYPEMGPPPRIESAGVGVQPRGNGGACSFLTGGIDSLCTLRRNRLMLPSTHPLAIQAAFTVHFVPKSNVMTETDAAQMDRISEQCGAVCADVGVTAIRVLTNLRHLEPDGNIFSFKWHSACLIAVAYFFRAAYSLAYLASSHRINLLRPWGSHPLLDPNYSSAHLRIQHDGSHLGRLAKTAVVAEWPVGLDRIRVCQGDSASPVNCGRCEKCIRTETALACLQKLSHCRAFADDDLTAEVLRTVIDYDMLSAETSVGYYTEAKPLLLHAGRKDLAAVVDEIADHYRTRVAQRSQRPGDADKGIGADAMFVLADDKRYGMPVRNAAGHYWGQPSGPDHAIRQIEAMRQAGYKSVIFAPGSWWLDYYKGLRAHLEQIGQRTVDTDGFVTYPLDAPRESQGV